MRVWFHECIALTKFLLMVALGRILPQDSCSRACRVTIQTFRFDHLEFVETGMGIIATKWQ